jgi:hypothetical protein
MKPELKDTITQLGIEYRLMTQFTSFVAVEEMIVTDGGEPRRIEVPVETPQGVSEHGFIAQFYLGGRSRGGGGGGVGFLRSARVLASATPPASMGSLQSTDAVLDPTLVPRPDESPYAKLRPKLHPSVFTIVERVAKKEALSAADEGGFVRNGKAEVQIFLTEKTDVVMTKLKELGFEVVLDVKTSNLIIGRLAIDKLEQLADQEFVKYISPQVTK